MATMDLFNKKNKHAKYNREYKDDWRLWKKKNKGMNSLFFPIFKDFEKEHLKDISPGALKLYLFFGFKSNEEGDSYYSVDSISKELGVNPRTVNKWIRILLDRGLIYRDKYEKRYSSHTYLKPYGINMFTFPSLSLKKINFQNTYNTVITDIKKRENLYGNIYKKYHFFQWKKNKPNSLEFINIFVLLTRKKYLEDSFVYGAYCMGEHNSSAKVIDTSEINRFATFESFYGKDVVGIAIDDRKFIGSTRNLKEVLYDLCYMSDDEIKEFDKVACILLKDYEENISKK